MPLGLRPILQAGKSFILNKAYLNTKHNTMKKSSPFFKNHYVGKAFISKLNLLLFAALLCFCSNLYAGISVVKPHSFSRSASAAPDPTVLTMLRLSMQTPLSPSFDGTTTSYTASVANSTASLEVLAKVGNPSATLKLNGSPLASNTMSSAVPLAVGQTTIHVVVSVPAHDPRTYTIVVTRALSTNADLTMLKLSLKTPLSPAFSPGVTSYTASVGSGISAIQVLAKVGEPTSTPIKLNGKALPSNTMSDAMPLATGTNTFTILVTAPSGATKTYTVVVTRPLSSNNNLTMLKLSRQTPLSPSFSSGTTSYTASVSSAVAVMEIIAKTGDPGSSFKLNGAPEVSNKMSAAMPLVTGPNTFTLVVTAPNGATKSYSVVVTRPAATGHDINTPLNTINTVSSLQDVDDGVIVHSAISPNGDGYNEALAIDKIAAYPNNVFMIMNSSGTLVYKATGYDNVNKKFDGRSNINGKLQKPGTYFYSLDYVAGGKNKHKTGYIVLRY